MRSTCTAQHFIGQGTGFPDFLARRASTTYGNCEAFDKKTQVDNVRGDVDFELGRWVIRQDDLRVRSVQYAFSSSSSSSSFSSVSAVGLQL